jgi:four helix bundle protein
MVFKNFEDIEAWQIARELNKSIYLLTCSQSFKDYSLKDQLQRASISIVANIAEGFDSDSNKSFQNFLSYSFRSASEVKSLLYISFDLNYITQQELDLFINKIESIKNLIGGLKRYLRSAQSINPKK